jgi:hypothetical protein
VQTAKTPIDSRIARDRSPEIHRLFHTTVKNSGRFPQLCRGENLKHGW